MQCKVVALLNFRHKAKLEVRRKVAAVFKVNNKDITTSMNLLRDLFIDLEEIFTYHYNVY